MLSKEIVIEELRDESSAVEGYQARGWVGDAFFREAVREQYDVEIPPDVRVVQCLAHCAPCRTGDWYIVYRGLTAGGRGWYPVTKVEW